jgi:hypothetical protein
MAAAVRVEDTLLGLLAIEFRHRGLVAQARAHVPRSHNRARELRQIRLFVALDEIEELLRRPSPLQRVTAQLPERPHAARGGGTFCSGPRRNADLASRSQAAHLVPNAHAPARDGARVLGVVRAELCGHAPALA